MAYDETLAERLRPLVHEFAAANASGVVEEKKMFGGLAFLVGGHIAVCAAGQGGLLLKVETSALFAELSRLPGVAPMMMGCRTSNSWLAVPSSACDDDADLAGWVDRGFAGLSQRS